MNVKVDVKVAGPAKPHHNWETGQYREVRVVVELTGASRGDAVVGAMDKAMSGARATLRSALNERL